MPRPGRAAGALHRAAGGQLPVPAAVPGALRGRELAALGHVVAALRHQTGGRGRVPGDAGLKGDPDVPAGGGGPGHRGTTANAEGDGGEGWAS